ncbi:MAG: hypothetical protein KME52_22640 [Desmonostoc geniculatum HA4340-LM1]|jgi:hypothetical protein|nr:hypothetical protein [Desmonostoc geniculatum HA4340-LM1]
MLSPNIEANHDTNLAELVQQVSASRSAIGLSVDGHQQAAILSLEAFKQLLSRKIYAEHGQLSEPEFHQQLQQALVEEGCDTREQIIDLVREVKREVAADYVQMYDYLNHKCCVAESTLQI